MTTPAGLDDPPEPPGSDRRARPTRRGPRPALTLRRAEARAGLALISPALVVVLLYSVVGTASAIDDRRSAIGVGLVAALALRRPFRGRGFVRAAMLLPYVVPIVAATFVWTTMLNRRFGS